MCVFLKFCVPQTLAVGFTTQFQSEHTKAYTVGFFSGAPQRRIVRRASEWTEKYSGKRKASRGPSVAASQRCCGRHLDGFLALIAERRSTASGLFSGRDSDEKQAPRRVSCPPRSVFGTVETGTFRRFAECRHSGIHLTSAAPYRMAFLGNGAVVTFSHRRPPDNKKKKKGGRLYVLLGKGTQAGSTIAESSEKPRGIRRRRAQVRAYM